MPIHPYNYGAPKGKQPYEKAAKKIHGGKKPQHWDV